MIAGTQVSPGELIMFPIIAAVSIGMTVNLLKNVNEPGVSTYK
jgi:hypothetical protein